jgi:hypothetical protein
MVLGSTKTVKEISTRNLPGGKGRPARKADNLTDICKPTVSQPCGSPRSVTKIALPFLYIDITFSYLGKQNTCKFFKI